MEYRKCSAEKYLIWKKDFLKSSRNTYNEMYTPSKESNEVYNPPLDRTLKIQMIILQTEKGERIECNEWIWKLEYIG